MSEMKIRNMKLADISAVAKIERESFPLPWSEEMIYRDLTEHSRAYFYVAEKENKILGHIAIWKSPDEIHLTTLAVASAWRRRKVGSALVKKIIDKHSMERSEIVLEVRESNRPALELYRKLGFEVRDRRLQYYVDNGEDALIMVYKSACKVVGVPDETVRTHTGNS